MKNVNTPPVKARLICNYEDELELITEKYGRFFRTDQATDHLANYVILCFIRDIIDNNNFIDKGRQDLGELVCSVVNKEVTNEILELMINSITIDLCALRSMVIQFKGFDRWLMHFVKEGTTNFIIEKSIDFRIYDWSIKNGKPF